LENKREVRSFPFCFFLFVKNVFLFSVFHWLFTYTHKFIFTHSLAQEYQWVNTLW
jgi:hypothetical protein